jgi:hypothetical protein
MKINFVQTIIAVALSLLISYGLFSFHANENKVLLSIGSFVFLSVTLSMTIGATFEFPRTTTNVRVISGIFFGIALLSNLIFTFLNFLVPTYIVVNGILLLLFILIAYSVNKAKQ